MFRDHTVTEVQIGWHQAIKSLERLAISIDIERVSIHDLMLLENILAITNHRRQLMLAENKTQETTKRFLLMGYCHCTYPVIVDANSEATCAKCSLPPKPPVQHEAEVHGENSER